MGLEIRRGGTPPEGWEMSWGADEDSLSSPLPSGHSRLLCPHGSFKNHNEASTHYGQPQS